MFRLTSLIYSLTSTVIIGVGIIIVLVAGYSTATAIVAAIAAGFALGLPVAWLIAKKLYEG